MGIGTPQTIANFATTTAGGATTTATTSANIASGDLVVLLIVNNTTFAGGASATVSSVSDGTNTYVKAVSRYQQAGFGAEIWYKENAAAVSSGATITVTWSNSIGSAAQAVAIQGARVTGIVTSGSLDKTSSNVGSGVTSLSTTTAALAQGLEIAFGGSWQSLTNGTYNGASGFTNQITSSLMSTDAAALDFDSVNSTSAITYNSSWGGTGGVMVVLVATFEGITSGTPAQVFSFFDSGPRPPNFAARMPFEAERKFPVPIINPAPGWSAFFDSGPPPASAKNQPFSAIFVPQGAIVSKTPQGWKTFFDSGPPPASAKNQPFAAAMPAEIIVSVTPQGWRTFFDSGPAPGSAARQPFESVWKFPVPAPPVPRGWSTFFDQGKPPPTAANQPFEAARWQRPIPIAAYSRVQIVTAFFPLKHN